MEIVVININHVIIKMGAKVDWDFQISGLVKKTLMELIFNPSVEFR